MTAALPTCAPLNDLSGDGFVDLWEHAVFQRCFSGENVAADALCAGWTPVIKPIQVELAACTGAPADPTGPNDAVPGRHFHRLTLDDPRAVCNDGTSAVIYVQAAPPGSPNADRWSLYFHTRWECPRHSMTRCAHGWMVTPSRWWTTSRCRHRCVPKLGT